MMAKNRRQALYAFAGMIAGISAGGTGMAAPAGRDTAEHGPAYLDDTYGKRALAWVAAEQNKTLSTLRADPDFAVFERQAAEVLTDPSRPGDVRFIGDQVYEYWQSREAPIGVWRRSAATAWLQAQPQWQTVIDFDALSAREGRRWIFGGAACRANGRCLVQLSDNGKDAAAIREFDLTTGAFVKGGFAMPVGKHRTWWVDDDTLLVAPVLDRGSVNVSLVPRTIRVWRRGEPIGAARVLFSIGDQDAMLSVSLINAAGTRRFVAARHLDFERREFSLIDLDGNAQRLPLPEEHDSYGLFQGKLLIRPERDWQPVAGGPVFPAGSLIGLSVEALMQRAAIEDVTLIYRPAGDDAVRGAIVVGNRLFVELLHDAYSRIEEVTPGAKQAPSPRRVPIADDRFVTVLGTPGGKLLVRQESPLEPERVSLLDVDTGAERILYQRKAAFDATGMTQRRYVTKSRDGTSISYLVMHKSGIALDKSHPALIYGYGGYDVAVTPRYEPVFGKLWLERGGIYVHAYLRGGGEHGPAWHHATMRERHPIAFDDMEAVIADVQRRGFSTPQRTGIIGRSNGGLLVAAVMQRRPDLINAVVVGGPLIDMLDFHRLPPGGTWLAEYGNPEVASDRAFLSAYSPMQNIADAAVAYPTPLIITATDDDRVLPGHARRYAEMLRAKGHQALYFEDKQGGHYWELAGGPVPGDWRLRATARAVEFTYLWQHLGK